MSENIDTKTKIRDSIIWLSTDSLGTKIDYDTLEIRTEAARDRIHTLTKGDPVSDYAGFKAIQYAIILDELGEDIGLTFEEPNNVIQIPQPSLEAPIELSATA